MSGLCPQILGNSIQNARDERKWPGIWPGMVGEMVGITYPHTPAHIPAHTRIHPYPLLKTAVFSDFFFEKFPKILLGTQEYFSYIPDEPYERDVQAQGTCALRFL